MRAEERKRLEARGWKVGSVKAFLELSEQESASLDLPVRSLLALGASNRDLGQIIGHG
ncbi:MAG TPA: hypothetical protein VHX52_10285 [Steroidobacteraceae bacterium]|jgi:hypothetical protein|nr:hypothetical protein [Steroidobacteraceae bacterium]